MPDTPRTRPAILRTTWRAWASTAAAMRAMPLAFLLTAAASVLVAAAIERLTGPTVVLPPPQPAPPAPAAIPLLLAALASSFAYALVAAPLAVAMHRFVVLGERPPLLPLRPLSRMLRYAAWVTLLGISASLPFIFLEGATPVLTGVASLASLVLMVATVRLTLLLPQIATRTPGQPLRTFWADTRWRFWNTATVLALSVMPALPLPYLITLAVHGRITEATLFESFDNPIVSVLNALWVAAAAAAASWLFLEYSRGGHAPDAVKPFEAPRPDPRGLEITS